MKPLTMSAEREAQLRAFYPGGHAHAGEVLTELDATRAKLARVLDVLKQVQHGAGGRLCPSCYKASHAPDCALAAALREDQ